MRQRQIKAGRDVANDLGGRALVSRIGVGKEEAHRDRFDTVCDECLDCVGDIVRHQRLDHLALGAESLAHLANPVSRQQHLGRRRENVEHILAAPLPPDLVDVAEAARGEKPDPHALAFEQRVERGSRAVQDQRHCVGAEVAHQVLRDVLQHGRRIGRIGEILAHGGELAPLLVERGHIGEGPADVYTHTQCHEVVFSRRSRAVAPTSMSRSVVSTMP
jgi:hypothetical protein